MEAHTAEAGTTVPTWARKRFEDAIEHLDRGLRLLDDGEFQRVVPPQRRASMDEAVSGLLYARSRLRRLAAGNATTVGAAQRPTAPSGDVGTAGRNGPSAARSRRRAELVMKDLDGTITAQEEGELKVLEDELDVYVSEAMASRLAELDDLEAQVRELDGSPGVRSVCGAGRPDRLPHG